MGLMNIRLPPLSINRGGRFIESTSKMAVGRNGMHREWRKRGKGAFGLYDKQTSSSPSSRLMTKTAHFLSCESHANHRGLYQLLLVFGFQRRGTAHLAELVGTACVCVGVLLDSDGQAARKGDQSPHGRDGHAPFFLRSKVQIQRNNDLYAY